MNARISQEDDVLIVHLIGRVNVETAEPFRETCLTHLFNKKVVFNFKELNFVGSSGIISFLETMHVFAQRSKEGFKFCGVGTEFRRVFSATPLKEVEIYENESIAAGAFRAASLLGTGQRMVVADVPFVIGVDAPTKIGDVDEAAMDLDCGEAAVELDHVELTAAADLSESSEKTST